MIRLLMVGDIFGAPGRKAALHWIPLLKEKYKLDAVIANCENAARGKGISKKLVKELMGVPISAMTSGNHIWASADLHDYLNTDTCPVIRPANFSPKVPGKGWIIVTLPSGLRLCVMNFIGQLFMDSLYESPFHSFDRLYEELKDKADLFVIDFHAETTSEKRAFGFYADGRAVACVGTHTHVQTADERILSKGCAYITDLGMTGPHDSVIGLKKGAIIHRFLTGMPVKFEVATRDVRLNGVIIEIDEKEKMAKKITRINLPLEDQE